MDLKERTKWAIDYICKKERISNTKIGKHLGFTNDTINSYRAKLANPKVEFIIKFCDAYDIDLIWFTKGDGAPFPDAYIRYPEVCSESRYELKKKSDTPRFISTIGSPKPACPPQKNKHAADNLTINSAEKSLLNLCKLMGTPINRGWKTSLAHYFGITSAQLSNCISRNRISKNLIVKIDEKGFSSDKWLASPPENTSLANTYPKALNAEMSLQKLALLAGIKIGPGWEPELAGLLGLDPRHVGMSISCGVITPDIIEIIEEKGYKPPEWLVFQETETLGATKNELPFSNTEVLKLAEKVLKSKTIHATALIMNIISLSHAVENEKI